MLEGTSWNSAVMERLTSALKSALEQKHDLQAVVSALENIAPTSEERQTAESSVKSYEDLVKKYRDSQVQLKTNSRSKALKTKSASQFFSLNFAKYRRSLKGYKTPNSQVVGFTDSDTHRDVLVKGARGLGIKCGVDDLAIICSGGLVPNLPIDNQLWTLGEYIKLNGGSLNRSKKLWGIYVPFDVDEEAEFEQAEPVTNSTLDSGVSSHGVTLEKYANTSTHSGTSAQRHGIGLERKRTTISSFIDKTKKLKLSRGITRESPLNVSSDSSVPESDPIEITMEDVVVKYGLIVDDKLSTSIVAVGQIGVWRLVQYETVSSDGTIFKQIAEEAEPFLPEQHDFIVIEICKRSSALTYLRADFDFGSSEMIELKNLKYHVLENRPVRSARRSTITTGYATLLVLSPYHGEVSYKWEKKGNWAWEMIDVPSSTCLLYVNCYGMYRCKVDDAIYYFEVIEKDNGQAQKDELMVDMKELEFGLVVGRGSFAEVHKGKWKGQEVALKRIRLPPGGDPSIVSKEVSVLRDLKHPNIVSLLGYSVDEEQVVLITNYVDGTNLERLLFSKKMIRDLSIDEALRIGVQISEAVHHMHTHDPIIIHQDIKPHNVLVTTDLKQVYVCDMGIAKVKRVAEATVTAISKGPGTFPYMAPEMFKKSHRGPAVDIYSLGCLFIELFGKQRVWPDLDQTAIMMKVVGSYEEPPQPPSTAHLAPPISEFCAQLCNLDPSKRPTIQEVLPMIKALQSKLLIE